MDICIVDKWRGTRIVPTKADPDPFATLRGLIASAAPASLEHKQVVFECDKEFMRACDLAATREAEEGKTDARLVPADKSGRVEGSTFDGIPIIVRED